MAKISKSGFRMILNYVIGSALLITGIVLSGSGVYRALRIRAPKEISECSELKNGECVEGTIELLRFHVKGASENNYYTGVFGVESGASEIDSHYGFIGYAAGKYRPVYVKMDSVESTDNRDREQVSFVGIVKDRSDSNFIEYTEYNLSQCDRLLLGTERVDGVNSDDFDALGIIVIDPKKEKRSWILGIPFLIAGAFFMLRSGRPFAAKNED